MQMRLPYHALSHVLISGVDRSTVLQCTHAHTNVLWEAKGGASARAKLIEQGAYRRGDSLSTPTLPKSRMS